MTAAGTMPGEVEAILLPPLEAAVLALLPEAAGGRSGWGDVNNGQHGELKAKRIDEIEEIFYILFPTDGEGVSLDVHKVVPEWF